MLDLYEQVSHKSRNNLPMKIYRTSGVYLHWHEEYEFIMIENGCALCVINGEPIVLKQNSVILLQSGVLHMIHPSSNNITAIVVSPSFWADKTVLELFSGHINFQSIFDHTDPVDLSVIEILKYIVKIYDEQCFGYEFIMKSKFTELFATLLQNGRFSHAPSLGKKLPAEFKNLMNYVHEHYSEKISLDTLSSISFYSKAYIIKLFKKYTNLTPSEYIIQYRLSMAKRMLQSSKENNLDIALACGFNSESYFIHIFKKHFGITPQAYRSRIKSTIAIPIE
ncbi:MAG: helix-turn-helix transcriptional regulator [Clostridia bacterium]|nr:helix-turn-helix transcriptional regulator [Clostridia bacterium]